MAETTTAIEAESGSSSIPLSVRIISKVLTFTNRLTRRKDHTLNRWLADKLETRVKASAIPKNGVFTFDVRQLTEHDPKLSSNKELWVRIFVPTIAQDEQHPKKKRPIVVYYHGGGFAVLSPDNVLYDIFCRRLAKHSRCIVVSANYRRAPEHRYPAAHEDGYQALKWVLSKPRELEEQGADFSKVFVSGDSAGGNIAHHCVYHGNAGATISGLILIHPFFGGQERTPAELRLKDVPVISLEASDWHWKAYLGSDEDRDHPVCNVFGPRRAETAAARAAEAGEAAQAADAAGLKVPTMVLVAEFDILQDWQTRYAQQLRDAGNTQVELVFHKGGVHAFHLFHNFPLSRQLLTDITGFINKHIN